MIMNTWVSGPHRGWAQTGGRSVATREARWVELGPRKRITENWYVIRHEGGASVAVAACSVSTPLNRIAFEGPTYEHNRDAKFEVVDKAEMKRRPNVVITK